jgi:hypothetical protein
MAADFCRQLRMGAAAEDSDFAQRCLPWHAPSDQPETLITDAFRAIKSVGSSIGFANPVGSRRRASLKLSG